MEKAEAEPEPMDHTDVGGGPDWDGPPTYLILAHGHAPPNDDLSRPQKIDAEILQNGGRTVINYYTVVDEGQALVGPEGLDPTQPTWWSDAATIMRRTACTLIRALKNDVLINKTGYKLRAQGAAPTEFLLTNDRVHQWDADNRMHHLDYYAPRFNSGVYECTSNSPVVMKEDAGDLDRWKGGYFNYKVPGIPGAYYTISLSDILKNIKKFHYVDLPSRRPPAGATNPAESVNVIGIFCLGGVAAAVEQNTSSIDDLSLSAQKKKSKRCPDGTKRSKNTGKCVKKRNTKRRRRRGRSRRPKQARHQFRHKRGSNSSKKPKKPRKPKRSKNR
tara:strand:+ start:1359 stop:2351 length:993 start_codon:yes stop_codon:yes gene_type:complete